MIISVVLCTGRITRRGCIISSSHCRGASALAFVQREIVPRRKWTGEGELLSNEQSEPGGLPTRWQSDEAMASRTLLKRSALKRMLSIVEERWVSQGGKEQETAFQFDHDPCTKMGDVQHGTWFGS